MQSPHGEPLDEAKDFAERATTGGLTDALLTILPALEQFLTFERPDPTAKQQNVWRTQLTEPLPNVGVGAQTVLKQLCDDVIPYGNRSGAPGFCGWVNAGPTTISVAALLAAAIAGCHREWVTAFNLIEKQALRWLMELVGIPLSYTGVFTSGGAIANLVCLGAARQHAYEQYLKENGIDPTHDGVVGILRPRLYASSEVQAVMHRAAGILCLDRSALVTLPATKTFQLDPAALREQLEADIRAKCTPLAVIVTLGTTSTGSIDPLSDVLDLCHEKGIWVHVDGAYGLLGALDPRLSSLYDRLNEADSLVLDPHKWLAIPQGCGAAFVRDERLLKRTFALGSFPPLQQTSPAADFYDVTSPFGAWGHFFGDCALELTSPARGVQVWASLKEIGAQGVRERVQRHNTYARILAKRIQASECLELLAPITLSICCFRYVPLALSKRRGESAVSEQLNDINQIVLQRLQERGRCIPSSTKIGGAFALRACFINPRATLADVEALVQETEMCGAEVWASLTEHPGED